MTARFPHPLRLIAHRGYSARHPENTLLAFEAAIEAGADAIELDVHLTTDRVPVVLHDAPRGAACDLDATVPTLEEVLGRIGSRIVIDVELKAASFQDPAPPDALERQIVDLLRRYGLGPTVFVSSFEPRFLERLPSEVARALLVEEVADPEDVIAAARRLGAFAVNPGERGLGEDEVGALHGAGLRVLPFTVDDPARARQLLGWGADGVFTNDPAGLRAFVEGFGP